MLGILRLPEMLNRQPQSLRRFLLRRLKRSRRFFQLVFIDYHRQCDLRYAEVMYAVPALEVISASPKPFEDSKYKETIVLLMLRTPKVCI
jgi:hypothetical protein